MNLSNVFALCGFLLLLIYEPANSTSASIMMDDNEYCGYSEAEEDLCASYCFKSVKAPLTYIIELKEQIKEKDSEIKELRKQLLEKDKCRDQIKANNQEIKYLNKTNEVLLKSHDLLKEFVQQEKQIAKNKEFITNPINNQKAEIEDFKEKEANGERNSQKLQQVEKDLIECKAKLPKDSCRGLPSGIRIITISGLDPFYALCNADIADGGGWMVIHRRFDGKENFQRYWNDFRNGFGRLEGEFFIGLELLHRITNSEKYELYVQIKHFNGTIQFASYDNFRIGNEYSKYDLMSLGEFKGTAVNQMKHNLHQKFSTAEQDNDKNVKYNCAQNGAWWYETRRGPNLNGRYYNEAAFAYDTLNWNSFEALKSTQMLIRPKSKV